MKEKLVIKMSDISKAGFAAAFGLTLGKFAANMTLAAVGAIIDSKSKKKEESDANDADGADEESVKQNDSEKK